MEAVESESEGTELPEDVEEEEAEAEEEKEPLSIRDGSIAADVERSSAGSVMR